MPARHLPPLASQTVGGGALQQQQQRNNASNYAVHHAGGTNNNRSEATKNHYDDDKSYRFTSSNGLDDNNGGSVSSQVHLPAVRPGSGANSSLSKYSPDSAAAGKQNNAPISPETALKLYMPKMSTFEHHEVYSFPHIYFVGHTAVKRAGTVGGANNDGYDDAQGSYIQVPHDHIAYRYEVLKIIGKGSFGQVVKAYDHKTNRHVAIKMVRNEKRFHHQAQEEIRILEFLKRQDRDHASNVVHLYEHFTFRNHICITFELLSMNLYELIKKNKFQGFSLQLVRKFAHSILQCLELLYNSRIIHCDMKPENIL